MITWTKDEAGQLLGAINGAHVATIRALNDGRFLLMMSTRNAWSRHVKDTRRAAINKAESTAQEWRWASII